MKKENWRKYIFEFISIFVAVVSAFALNNWNDHRRDKKTETKILTEMSSGLLKDINDLENNIKLHKIGIQSCNYWKKAIVGDEINQDSLALYYLYLTRGYYPVQNNAAYETLKSNGLELIENDSLRFEIISLYEYDYYILKRQEEEAHEMQFAKNYSNDINKLLSKNFQFDKNGKIVNLKVPLLLTNEEEQLFLTYLWQIETNRKTILKYYNSCRNKVQNLRNKIEALN